MYADDIVLLAESEGDLQQMLNALFDWCNSNFMNINTTLYILGQNLNENQILNSPVVVLIY